jgi:D-arginine dehydrogenase
VSEATLQADVAVIGAGVAGLSIAYFLAPHARVVVLEQEAQPAYHSSGRSAALFIEGYENSVVSGLTTASRDFFFAPPPGFADAPLVHPRGGLTVASKDERGALQTYLQRWQPLCPDLQAVTPARARELVPVLREDWLGGAAYDPSWQSIDVHELLMGYQRGLKAAGGRVLCNAPAHSLTRESGARGTTPRWHIETPAASVSAAVVVNAGGAWANRVAAAAGLEPLPVTPMRRTAAIVPLPEEGRMWPVVHTIAGNLYFKPESPGLMVCPQDESPKHA